MSTMDRRQFMATLPAAAAATSTPLLATAGPDVTEAPMAAAGLAATLARRTPAQRAQLLAALPEGMAEQVHWNWQDETGHSCWSGDGLQQHTRYGALPEGADLAGLAPSCRAAAPQELDACGTRRAHALALRTRLIIVHRGKAAAHGLRTPSLAGFAARGLKPLFFLNPAGSAAENSWLLPLFAGALGLAALDRLPDRLTAQDQEALGRLIDKGLAHLELQVLHRPQEPADLGPLLDPASPVAAVHASAALLGEALRGRTAGGVARLSEQEFLATPAPSLFAASMLQIGEEAQRHPAMAPLLRALLAQAQDGAAAPGDAPMGEHDPVYYRRLKHLARLSDGGLLARLALEIDAALRHGRGRSTALEIGRYACARAGSLAA